MHVRRAGYPAEWVLAVLGRQEPVSQPQPNPGPQSRPLTRLQYAGLVLWALYFVLLIVRFILNLQDEFTLIMPAMLALVGLGLYWFGRRRR